MGLQHSMRDIEDLTNQLAEQAPDMYEGVNRNMVSQLEAQGLERLRVMNHRAQRAIVKVVFGSQLAFLEATGLDLHLSGIGEDAEHRIPLFDEGEGVVPHEMLLGTPPQQVVSPTRGARYAIRVKDSRHMPVLFPGQIVYVEPRATPPVGSLCVLHHHGRLSLFHRVDEQRFARPSGQVVMLNGATVIGHVVSLDPTIPAQFLTDEELAAG